MANEPNPSSVPPVSPPKVGMLFANSGEYEDYRARPCEVYESVEMAQAEADRRNALVGAARDLMPDWGSVPDEKWEAAERKQKRILGQLRRKASDPDIEPADVHDLTYTVTEARMIHAGR
jgi:hypothetical protein